jgi:MIP family channel proteins
VSRYAARPAAAPARRTRTVDGDRSTPPTASPRTPSLGPDPRRWAAEALGTFALVALGPGAAMVAARTGAFGHAGVALAFGLAVTLIVAASGHLGGAPVHPAVSVGLWSVRRFPGRDVLPYVLAQSAGAVAGSLLLRWLLGPVGGLGATVPALSLDRAFVVEAGYTALLGFVIMGVATDERVPAAVAPFALGITVFAGALVTGPLTGGSFNPARSLGPAVAGGGWTAHWLYWVAPILGMALGMRCYDWLRGASPAAVAAAVPRGVPLGVEGPIGAASAPRSTSE